MTILDILVNEWMDMTDDRYMEGRVLFPSSQT